MSERSKSFSHLRPWARLDEPTERLLRVAYGRPWLDAGESAEVLAFEAKVPAQAIYEAVDRGLLSQDKLQPTALGALYVDEAVSDLQLLDQVMRTLAARYVPGGGPLALSALEALGHPSPQFERVLVLAGSIDVRVVRVGSLTSLQPTLRDWELPTLEARVLDRFRWKFSRQGGKTSFGVPKTLAIRLTGLHVRNFRALRSLDIELRPLNVIVGANASGKSTLLDAIGFVATSLHHGLQRALDDGGLERTLTFGAEGPLRIGLDFKVIRDAAKSTTAAYSFAVSQLGHVAVVEEERLESSPGGAPYVDGQRGLAVLRLVGGELEEQLHAAGSLVLEDLVDETKYPFQTQVRASLQHVALVDRDPLLIGEGGWSGGRRRSRSSLLDVTALLRFIAEDPARTERLGRDLAALVPHVTGLEAHVVKKTSIGMLAADTYSTELLVWEEGVPEPLRLDEISAGTRQMLLLCALHLQETAPTVLLVEEPDGGVHPGALPALRDLLRSLATRCTVVATTHSPQLVALLDPEQELLALDRTEGGVMARSLAQALGSQKWLRAFGAHEDAFLHRATDRTP